MTLTFTVVIIFSIQICRHNTKKSILTIFLVVEATLDLTHALGHCISLIGGMRRAKMQPLLEYGVRLYLIRVDTGTKHTNQPFHPKFI